MRKVLLISLAAVIVAGGLAMVVYGERAPRGEARPGGRPGGGEQRGGPRGPQFTEEQSAKLAELAKGPIGKALNDAVADFQKAVKDALKGSIKDEAQLNRAVRMATFRAIMQRPRPPGEREGDRDRDRERDRRPDRPKKRPE